MARWTPAHGAGLATWLKADALAFPDAYVFDDPGELLTDASGRGVHWHFVLGGDIEFEHDGQNGLPLIRFNASLINEITTEGIDLDIPSGPMSAALVIRDVPDGIDLWSDLSQQYMVYSQTGSLKMYAGTAVTVGTMSATNPHVITTIFNGAASRGSVDGTASAALNPGANLPDDSIVPLGVTINNGAFMGLEFVGGLGEAIFAEGAWTAAERQTHEGYLAHKWGVPLASGHPYETHPPLLDSAFPSTLYRLADTPLRRLIAPVG